MPRSNRTAKNKLNAAHLQGALVIAGLLGLITGSWLVFFVAIVAMIATAVHDGSIRL